MKKCDRIGVMIRCGNLVITPYVPFWCLQHWNGIFYLLIDSGKISSHFEYLNMTGFRESSINRKFLVMRRKIFRII